MKTVLVFFGITFFLIISQFVSAQIVGYEYWFNFNLNTKETIQLNPSNNQIILSNISTENLDCGINYITIRTFDLNNDYSSPIVHPFIKQPNFNLSQIDSFNLRYWFDNQINNFSLTSFNGTHFLQNINTQNINPGIHLFSWQIKQHNDLYSVPLNDYVLIKNSSTNDTAHIVKLEYWFDNDLNTIQEIVLEEDQNIILIDSLFTSNISAGLHTISLRFLDQANLYSSVISHLFLKSPEYVNQNPEIIGFEYWIDQLSNEPSFIPITPSQSVIFISTLPINDLSMGVHQFYYRFLDNLGLYSPTLSAFFFKSPIDNNQNVNHLTDFIVWIDNDISNKEVFPITSLDSILTYNQSLDLTNIFKGSHSLTYQFKDSRNIYSAPITDTFVKLSLPIANFDFLQLSMCDSSMIYFIDHSIDGDSYFWDFGDGSFDSIINPSHFFAQPGAYNVSLTVSDTLTLQNNTFSQAIIIYPSNYEHLFDTICFGDSYQFVDSLIMYDLQNDTTYNCTLITIHGCFDYYQTHLSVIKIDTAVVQNGLQLISHQDNATYQWIRCDLNNEPILGAVDQEFNAVENGIYAVIIYKNNCVDTSSHFIIDNVKIEDHFHLSNFISYPNPTNGEFNVVFDNQYLNIIVSLYTFDGKLITNKGFLNTNNFTINLSSYQNGLYFLKVSTENGSATIPIVKL